MMNDLTARSVLRFALAVAGTVTLAAIAATCLTLSSFTGGAIISCPPAG